MRSRTSTRSTEGGDNEHAARYTGFRRLQRTVLGVQDSAAGKFAGLLERAEMAEFELLDDWSRLFCELGACERIDNLFLADETVSEGAGFDVGRDHGDGLFVFDQENILVEHTSAMGLFADEVEMFVPCAPVCSVLTFVMPFFASAASVKPLTMSA